MHALNSKHFVGLDGLFASLEQLTRPEIMNDAFPPHNIVKHTDSIYSVELACAGYSPKDLTVSIEGNYLVILGKKQETDTKEYLYKGISSKTFRKSILVPDTIEVESTVYSNGILKILMTNKLPEKTKKTFTIKVE